MALNLRNIISMEDGEYEPVDQAEAEIAVDEVEASEVAEEVVTDVDTLGEYGEQLDETQEEVEELEATRDTIEESLEDPNYEGLDEVSAELIGQRLRNISKRRGFDVDRVEGVFSKETFNSRTSNRRRKTEVALEGIKDAIVAMWERIKAAIKAVWNAIKEFWKKHISTLGRLLKTLEATKKKVRDVKGHPDASKKPKPGGSMQKVFFSKNDESISPKLIGGYITKQLTATAATRDILGKAKETLQAGYNVIKIGEKQTTTLSTIAEPIKKIKEIMEDGGLGKEDDPLAGGWFCIFETEGEEDEVPSVGFKWDNRDVKPDDKREMEVGQSAELVDLCEGGISVVKDSMNLGNNFQKVSNDYDKILNEFSRAVSAVKSGTDRPEEDRELSENEKKVREEAGKTANKIADDHTNKVMKLFNDVTKSLPKINSKVVGLNVMLCKEIVTFCKMSYANHKN